MGGGRGHADLSVCEGGGADVSVRVVWLGREKGDMWVQNMCMVRVRCRVHLGG